MAPLASCCQTTSFITSIWSGNATTLCAMAVPFGYWDMSSWRDPLFSSLDCMICEIGSACKEMTSYRSSLKFSKTLSNGMPLLNLSLGAIFVIPNSSRWLIPNHQPRKCLGDSKVLLHGDSTTHGLLQEALEMWSEVKPFKHARNKTQGCRFNVTDVSQWAHLTRELWVFGCSFFVWNLCSYIYSIVSRYCRIAFR